MSNREKQFENKLTIMRYLHEDPTAEYSDIAAGTHLSMDQVKHCLDDLRKEQHIRKGFVVNLRALGYKFRYRVDIFVNPISLRNGEGGLEEDAKDFPVSSQKKLAEYILNYLPTKERFKNKVFVEDVRILLGHPSDLSATVHAVDNDAMLNFVTEGLRMCKAVSQTASCLEAWSTIKGKTSDRIDPSEQTE